MGGARKVIDPMNIMDPGGILPGPKGGKFGTYSGAFGGGKKGKKSGGKGNGGGKSDPTMDFLAQLQEQQKAQAAAAAEAQRQALIQSQIQSGAQLETSGEQAARQQLATMGSMQAIKDANALASLQQQQATQAQQATGGGFDVNAAQQAALENMGATSGMLPATSQNVPYTATNPALSSLVNQGASAKRANMFNMPQSSDLKFGGL